MRVSHRRRLTAAAVLALMLAGCGGSADDDRDPNPIWIDPPFASAPESDGPYRAVDDLCTAVDLAPLEKLWGPRGHQNKGLENSDRATSTLCTSSMGNLTGQAVVMVAVGSQQTGRIMWSGLRQVDAETHALIEVTGLGEAAYAYHRDSAGWRVVAYDRNLFATASASALGNTPDPPGPEMVERLSKVIRGTMAALRR